MLTVFAAEAQSSPTRSSGAEIILQSCPKEARRLGLCMPITPSHWCPSVPERSCNHGQGSFLQPKTMPSKRHGFEPSVIKSISPGAGRQEEINLCENSTFTIGIQQEQGSIFRKKSECCIYVKAGAGIFPEAVAPHVGQSPQVPSGHRILGSRSPLSPGPFIPKEGCDFLTLG